MLNYVTLDLLDQLKRYFILLKVYTGLKRSLVYLLCQKEVSVALIMVEQFVSPPLAE